MEIRLSPTQAKHFHKLLELIPHHEVFVLWGHTGLGKTTILQALYHELGGKFIGISDFLSTQAGNVGLEENLWQVLMDAFRTDDLVYVDDLHLLDGITASHTYPRHGLLDMALKGVCSHALECGKKIVFAHTAKASPSVDSRCFYLGFDRFSPEDYRFICALGLERPSPNLDFERIYRFSPRLNAHQLKTTCKALQNSGNLETDSFVGYLLEHHLASNVSIAEVEKMEMAEIKGLDDILRALETHVILPLEQNTVARELDLKPKKGVLLYGPPGSGKTSIGRILAHRLKGKFFSIDGRFISSTREFYEQVHQVFEAARQNAPSIIFIDESDVFWAGSEDTGLYRYLLTELDGVEGARAGTLCVMMTAMGLAQIPPALVRSGRIELWLELTLPNEKARGEILQYWIDKLANPLREIDAGLLSRHTEQFSAADLRRITEDVKNLYAYDKVHQNPIAPIGDYFLGAIKTIREDQKKKAKAEQNLKAADMPLFSFSEFIAKIPKLSTEI